MLRQTCRQSRTESSQRPKIRHDQPDLNDRRRTLPYRQRKHQCQDILDQDSIDFLDTWSGLSYPAQSGSSAVSSAASTAASTAAVGTGAAAIRLAEPTTCIHAADPGNTCAAIDQSKGWCDCGNSDVRYKIAPSGQPCVYTTSPTPTVFHCPTPTA